MGETFKINKKNIVKNNNVLERIFIKNMNNHSKKRLKLIKGTEIVSNLTQNKDKTKTKELKRMINRYTIFNKRCHQFLEEIKFKDGRNFVPNCLNKYETHNQYEKMSDTQYSINPLATFFSESYIEKNNAEKCFMCMVYVKNCTNLREKKRKNRLEKIWYNLGFHIGSFSLNLHKWLYYDEWKLISKTLSYLMHYSTDIDKFSQIKTVNHYLYIFFVQKMSKRFISRIIFSVNHLIKEVLGENMFKNDSLVLQKEYEKNKLNYTISNFVLKKEGLAKDIKITLRQMRKIYINKKQKSRDIKHKNAYKDDKFSTKIRCLLTHLQLD